MISANPFIFGKRSASNVAYIHRAPGQGFTRIGAPTILLLTLLANALALGVAWKTINILMQPAWTTSGQVMALTVAFVLFVVITLRAYLVKSNVLAHTATQTLLFLAFTISMGTLLGGVAALLDKFTHGFGSRLITAIAFSQIVFAVYSLADRALDKSGRDLSCSIIWTFGVGTIGVSTIAFLIAVTGCIPTALCSSCSVSILPPNGHHGWLEVIAVAIMTFNATVFAHGINNEVISITEGSFTNRGLRIGVAPHLAIGLLFNNVWHFVEIALLPVYVRRAISRLVD